MRSGLEAFFRVLALSALRPAELSLSNRGILSTQLIGAKPPASPMEGPDRGSGLSRQCPRRTILRELEKHRPIPRTPPEDSQTATAPVCVIEVIVPFRNRRQERCPLATRLERRVD